MEGRPPIWRIAANILNKQSRAGDRVWSSNIGVERGVNNSSSKKISLVTKRIHSPRTWTDPLVQRKQWKRDMRFGLWNVRRLYGSGSLTAATRELATYKLELVGVQEVRWDKGGTVSAKDCICFSGKETKIINWEQDFLYTTE